MKKMEEFLNTHDEIQAKQREENRKASIRALLRVLRNPLILMSIPDREAAVKLAAQYQITAAELIEAAVEQVRNT